MAAHRCNRQRSSGCGSNTIPDASIQFLHWQDWQFHHQQCRSASSFSTEMLLPLLSFLSSSSSSSSSHLCEVLGTKVAEALRHSLRQVNSFFSPCHSSPSPPPPPLDDSFSRAHANLARSSTRVVCSGGQETGVLNGGEDAQSGEIETAAAASAAWKLIQQCSSFSLGSSTTPLSSTIRGSSSSSSSCEEEESRENQNKNCKLGVSRVRRKERIRGGTVSHTRPGQQTTPQTGQG